MGYGNAAYGGGLAGPPLRPPAGSLASIPTPPVDHKTAATWFDPWSWHVEVVRGPLLFHAVVPK